MNFKFAAQSAKRDLSMAVFLIALVGLVVAVINIVVLYVLIISFPVV